MYIFKKLFTFRTVLLFSTSIFAILILFIVINQNITFNKKNSNSNVKNNSSYKLYKNNKYNFQFIYPKNYKLTTKRFDLNDENNFLYFSQVYSNEKNPDVFEVITGNKIMCFERARKLVVEKNLQKEQKLGRYKGDMYLDNLENNKISKTYFINEIDYCFRVTIIENKDTNNLEMQKIINSFVIN